MEGALCSSVQHACRACACARPAGIVQCPYLSHRWACDTSFSSWPTIMPPKGRGHSHWLPRPRPGHRHRKSTQAQAPHASGCTLSDSVPGTGVAAHHGVLAASVPVTRNVGSLLYSATVVCDSHRFSQTDCSHAANSGPTTALASTEQASCTTTTSHISCRFPSVARPFIIMIWHCQF